MNIYNKNMHIFMTQCGIQKMLSHNPMVFIPAFQEYSKYDDNVNNYYYNK